MNQIRDAFNKAWAEAIKVVAKERKQSSGWQTGNYTAGIDCGNHKQGKVEMHLPDGPLVFEMRVEDDFVYHICQHFACGFSTPVSSDWFDHHMKAHDREWCAFLQAQDEEARFLRPIVAKLKGE